MYGLFYSPSVIRIESSYLGGDRIVDSNIMVFYRSHDYLQQSFFSCSFSSWGTSVYVLSLYVCEALSIFFI